MRGMNGVMRARAIGRMAFTAALLMPIVALGQSTVAPPQVRVQLDYASAPGCPDALAFKTIVAEQLGYDPFQPPFIWLVQVTIDPSNDSFEGRFVWRTLEGKWVGDRTFPSRSADCGGLGRAMAFALALQIRFNALAEPPASEPETSSEATPVPPPKPPTNDDKSEAVAVPPPPVFHPTLEVGIGAGGASGLAGRPLPLGRLFGRSSWRHTSLECSAEIAWPTLTRREDGAGFTQHLALVGLAGCGDRLPFRGCLLAKAGGLWINGKDIGRPLSPFGLIVETGLGVSVVQSLGRYLFLAARAEGLINLTRWRVTLDQEGVWTAPWLAATVGLELGIRFERNPGSHATEEAEQ